MATTFDILYLGVLPVIDPVEGNITAENAAALTGLTAGTADRPLAGYVQSLSVDSTAAGDALLYDNDNLLGGDTFRIDGGPVQTFDAVVSYSGTLTYTDGTTATGTFTIFQDTDGRTYLAPDLSQTTEQDALEAKPIASFTFGAAGADSTGMEADREFATFDDGAIVQGTTQNDSMGGGYTDADGDQIDGGDNTIHADAGNDYVDGGAGSDTIFGGSGNDYIVGGDGDDILYGDDGHDTLVGNAGSDTIYGGAGDDLLDDEIGWENGTSADTFYGGGGNDTIYLGGGDDIGYGGDGNDLIGGEEGHDLIYGGAGDDQIYGYGDNDTLYGESGNDNLMGDDGDDTLYGGDGVDGLFGGSGNDTLAGGAGADWLFGGTGSDTVDYASNSAATTVNLMTGSVSGGDADGDYITEFESIRGSDYDDNLTLSNISGKISAGAGNDTLTGGDGDDELDGGAGNDALYGGAGNDYMISGTGNNALFGGDGDDTLITSPGGVWDNTLYGNGGDDAFALVQGNATAFGGDGSDLFFIADTVTSATVVGGSDLDSTDFDMLLLGSFGSSQSVTVTYTGNEAGTFSIDGGGSGTFTGIEWIEAGEGGDFIDASLTTGGEFISGYDGDDTILGGSGDDELSGDIGSDTIAGGAGNDTIYGGDGDDTLRGGAGDDTLSGEAGNDTFALDRAGGADVVTDFDLGDVDTDGFYNDQLDVSELRTPGGDPVRVSDVTVIDDGFGNAKLIFPEGETVVLQGVSPAQMSTAGQLYRAGIPCFTPGTMIRTPGGERPVEALRPGDLVLTRDNGPQRLVWVGMRRLDAADLDAAPQLRPIRIAPRAFGNYAALVVSPQHGLLLAGPAGQGTQLVRARHLAGMKGGQARVMQGARQVTYVHLMCEAHQIVISNGLPSESFYPGPQALAMLHLPELHELLGLFPDLRQGALAAVGPTARPVVRRSALPGHLRDMQGAPL